jgi:hypothetical protein
MHMVTTDSLIVGAGLCGLLAAHTLATQGRRVLVVDKGHSVGGRLATRRIGPGLADHGAQFFTVRDPAFQRWVDAWLADGLVYPWSHGWSDGSLSTAPPDGYPRYAVRGGMNQLAKTLAAAATAAGASINVNTRLVEITPTQAGWRAVADGGQLYQATTLVLTAPVPQSLALLAAGATPLAAADRAALEAITYAPCLCGLFWVAGAVALPEPGALQRPEADITWIADNQRKGISPHARLLTVHGGPTFSQRHYSAPEAEVLTMLQAAVTPYFGADPVIHEAQLKRWRYAAPLAIHPARYLAAADLPPLYFGGDAFGGPRVEGAARSGLAIGAALAQTL